VGGRRSGRRRAGPLLAGLVPVSERLRGYRGDTLRRDLLAGVTVAALALPAAMAHGELAGLTDHLYPTVRAAVQAAEAASVPGSPSAGDGRPPPEAGP
jgi:MFS superfamily sulfate permease-like transporter